MPDSFLETAGTVSDEAPALRAQTGARDAPEQLLTRHRPCIFDIAFRGDHRFRTGLPVLAAIAVMLAAPPWASSGGDPAQEVLALERQAMDGWLKGNPDPQLAISDPQITYIHAVLEKRLEGLPALKELFEQYRGMPLFDSYEILDPKVQLTGDVAVLTYQLLRRNRSATTYWNATQVYCRKKEGWRIIHTHWSAVKAQP